MLLEFAFLFLVLASQPMFFFHGFVDSIVSIFTQWSSRRSPSAAFEYDSKCIGQELNNTLEVEIVLVLNTSSHSTIASLMMNMQTELKIKNDP